MKRLAASVGAVLVVAVLISGWIAFDRSTSQKRASADFAEVVQLYKGDEIKVLGVPVGEVTAVTPGPSSTRVEFVYDADAPVPADVKAAIISPSLVSGRYIQLSPAKEQGPRLPEGAAIPLARTAVPVEFDEVKNQLNELASALGPNGINRDGSLNRAIGTLSSNLSGNGRTLNETAGNLARAVGILSDGRDDLFATVRNLATVVAALRQADHDVSPFMQHLTSVSSVLAQSSGETKEMLTTLDASVADISEFVNAHRARLGSSVDGLAHVLKNVADNRQALADLIQKLPGVISNFANIYDPFTGSVRGGLALTQFQDLPGALCAAVIAEAGSYDKCKSAFAPSVSALNMSYPPVAWNGIQRNGSKNCIEVSDAAPPDPDPQVYPRLDTRDNRPNLGYGTQPEGAHCGDNSGGNAMLRQLFAPSGAPR
jgi:phospholipid/cholesterol/gamma-HCH transport system substrate-binding protein